LLHHMPLFCLLTHSTLRRVHGHGRCMLPNDSVSGFRLGVSFLNLVFLSRLL
jgi:hypothetical protein